jgi:hypothetical protein
MEQLAEVGSEMAPLRKRRRSCAVADAYKRQLKRTGPCLQLTAAVGRNKKEVAAQYPGRVK